MLQAVVAGRQRGRGGRPLRREHGAVVVGERVNDAHGGEVWADLGGEMVASPVEKEGCCGGGAVGEGGGEKTPFSLLALEGREGESLCQCQLLSSALPAKMDSNGGWVKSSPFSLS